MPALGQSSFSVCADTPVDRRTAMSLVQLTHLTTPKACAFLATLRPTAGSTAYANRARRAYPQQYMVGKRDRVA